MAAALGAALLAAPAAAQSPWHPAELTDDQQLDARQAQAVARAVDAQMLWRARWRLTADLGFEVLPLGYLDIGGLPHRFRAHVMPSIGVGTRRALLAWLELDLRVGATFGMKVTSDLRSDLCASYYNTDLPEDDPARSGAVLSVGGSLRLRPTGALRPFDVSLGVRGYLAALTSAGPMHYRCGDRVDPTVPGDLRTIERPAAAGGTVVMVAGIGAHFGPRELIGTTLETTFVPNGEWRDIGARFAVSVTLF